MKKIVKLMIMGVALAVTAVQADDSHHPGKEAAADVFAAREMGQGMDMMDMEQMQKRMQQMQQMMDRINKSDDADERQRLMQEHMRKMRDMMAGMRGMMGSGMMNQDMMGQGMMGQGMMGQNRQPGASSGDKMGAAQMDNMTMEQRQDMMSRRMDMIQGLMEQMMEQMMQQQRFGQDGMKK